MKLKKWSIIGISSIVVVMAAFFLYSFHETNSYTALGSEKTEVEFSKLKVDLKTIPLKSKKEMVFEFKNTGEFPLIIYDVSASCDCADIKFPKKPIMPNKNSKIKITYLAKKEGGFNRVIRVYGNFVDSPKAISIKGECKKSGNK